jgi:hypothetical protein
MVECPEFALGGERGMVECPEFALGGEIGMVECPEFALGGERGMVECPELATCEHFPVEHSWSAQSDAALRRQTSPKMDSGHRGESSRRRLKAW